MANELTTTTVATTTDLAHANLARYAKTAQGAFAPNNGRALRAGTASFSAWCHAAGVPALPAASQTVADFIDAVRAASKRPATIRCCVSSIAHLHRAAELPVLSDSLPDASRSCEAWPSSPTHYCVRRCKIRAGGRTTR